MCNNYWLPSTGKPPLACGEILEKEFWKGLVGKDFRLDVPHGLPVLTSAVVAQKQPLTVPSRMGMAVF